MARDPVCGMDLTEPTAFTHDHKGERYHFCSKHCSDKFSQDPDHYVTHVEAAPAQTTIYTCPMHPEIREVGPGSCAK